MSVAFGKKHIPAIYLICLAGICFFCDKTGICFQVKVLV